MPDSDTGAPPRVLLVTAAALALALAVAVAVFALTKPDEPAAGPLPLVSVPAPQAASPACATLTGSLPAELTSNGKQLKRRELANPAPPATAAWGDADPVVLRCGLDRPAELTPTAQLRLIDGVQWLQVPGESTATWYVVDREVYLALTVSTAAGTGPLQEISDTVAAKLPPRPLRFS